MRSTVIVACGLIGTALVVLSLLNPPVSDAYRPYALAAGVGMILLGLILASARAARPRRPRTIGVRETGDRRHVTVAETAVSKPAPPGAPTRAEVTLRAGGNDAAEAWVRWYHVEAATTGDVAASKARVNVAVRGEQVAAEPWQWQGGSRVVDVREPGIRIPLVIGGVGESAQPTAAGWVVPFRNWYLTPSGRASLGRFLAPFISGFRHLFEVTVTWTEGGSEQRTSASFELRFWREPTSEPRFIRLGDRPSYRDQSGGLAELRARGVALRNDGMMLPPASLAAWLGRVDTWTNEARDLIAEVSVADSEYFLKLATVEAPLFEGVRLHDDRHRQVLRGLHERLNRLQTFIRT